MRASNKQLSAVTSTARLTLALLIAVSAVSASAKTQTGDSGVEKELKLQVGDEAGNEVKALKTELLVIKSEKKALDQLLHLQTKYANTRMEPEILFRLAELYMRRARSERFFEVHKGDQQIMSFAPTMVKEASEAAEIRKAIAFYVRIQEKYPRFHAMDVVYFNGAYAHQQVGEDNEAEALFQRLIKEQGGSPLIPDAYLSIGEINFKARKYQVALENFKHIREFPQSRVYPYGLYKAAWSYYNLQDAASGMVELEDVIKFGAMVAQKKWDSKLDLRKEALGDLALFYGDTKDSKAAVDYFRAQAMELDASTYIMHLVAIYKRHGRFNDVELVLKELLAKMPTSEAVPQAHEELVWNYDHTKHPAAAATQMEAFNAYCEALPAKVDPKAKKSVSAPRSECSDKIAEISKKLASKWHATWKKFGEPLSGDGAGEMSASAQRAYKLYFKAVSPKDVEVSSVRYAYAELLFARKDYREASESYAMIADYQKSGLQVDAKIAQDARYGAVLSLEKSVNDKWSDEDEKRFNVLTDEYLAHHANGQYALELRFKRAFIAYEKERYDEAAPQFKKIGWDKYTAEQASNEKIAKAQDLYLDILNIKKTTKASAKRRPS